MTTVDWLYVVLAVVVVVVGLLLSTVLWQLSVLVASLRGAVLPQIQTVLTDIQKSLVHAQTISADVERKLDRLDDTVNDAQITVHSLAEATKFLSDGIAKPFMIQAASLVSGTQAAWKRYRELHRKHQNARWKISPANLDRQEAISARDALEMPT